MSTTISQPMPTTGRRADARYYEVTVEHQLMPLRYRLHNEQQYGIDCQGAFADSAPMWHGTNMDTLSLPTEIVSELRARWNALFPPTNLMGLCPGCEQHAPINETWLICDSCLIDRVNGAGELELDDPDDELAVHFAARRRTLAIDAEAE